MRRWRRVAIVAAAAALVAVGVVGARPGDRTGWPPDWYVDPGADREEFAALRRDALATASTEFPPNAPAIAYLRNLAVGAATAPGSRLDEARVYPGAGYVLQLRGRFSTAEIRWPPSRRRRVLRPFRPCLTFILDTATLSGTGTSLGECEDFSFLGEGVELDLRDERA